MGKELPEPVFTTEVTEEAEIYFLAVSFPRPVFAPSVPRSDGFSWTDQKSKNLC
jgi:hypothetical protein